MFDSLTRYLSQKGLELPELWNVRGKYTPSFEELFNDFVVQLTKLRSNWEMRRVSMPWEALQGIRLHEQFGRVAVSW